VVDLEHRPRSVESGGNLFQLALQICHFFAFGDLKVIIDGDPNMTKLLMDIVLSTMAFVSTTYNFDGERSIWKGPDWECMFIGFLACKVCFQFVVYLCDREAFLHLFPTMTKYQFSSKLQLEFELYMAVETKVPLEKETFTKTLVLFYAYLFFNRVGVNIKKDVLGSKLFSSLVQSKGLPIPSDQKLYNYEICFEALKMIMDPILQRGMGCLNVYEGGALILLCLVSISLKCI
jgi:hypothetical protein